MSKQAAPQCCGQTAEFVVNGASQSLQYYYCRVCKTEPHAKVAEQRSDMFGIPKRTLVSCAALTMAQGHDFTSPSGGIASKCRACGEPSKGVWDGQNHSWCGDGTSKGSFCALCGVVYHDHKNSPLITPCPGSNVNRQMAMPTQGVNPTPMPSSQSRAPMSAPLPTKMHVWAVTVDRCIDCGITGAEYANYNTSCDHYKKVGPAAFGKKLPQVAPYQSTDDAALKTKP